MTNRSDRRAFLQCLAGASGACALANVGPASAEDRFLTSAKLGSFELYYEIHGDGPPIVFAHGAGGTHMSWWQQIPALSQHYRCITIDHRTFGLSRDTKDGPGRRAFVGDLTALLDHLGIQKTALVGQSMGGTTVLGFTSAHSERVSALIMSDTTGGYSDEEMEKLRRSLPQNPRSAFARDFPKRDPARAFLYREISAITEAYNGPAAAAPAAGAASTASAAPPPTDVRPILAKKIPTLFIVGEEDQLIAPQIIELMHRKMPGSEFAKVPGAGHSDYFEKPDEYNRLVLAFLDKHARA
jgi:pimeloyl-ACP methyl ester carboxylesterase